jgi:hypothetical protein
MREAEQYALLAKAAKELRDKEERLHERIMLSHVAREWRGDLYVRLLRKDLRGDDTLWVIREVGLGALRPEAWEVDEAAPGLQEVRALVWRRIDEWYRLARGDDVHQRQEAATLLKKLGGVLAGDRRGKRARRKADPIRVLYEYRQNLLRLKRARELLRQLTGIPGQTRIEKVAEACSIPLGIFREHLSMSEADEVQRHPLPIEHTARVWTARKHGITEQTVSNVLSKSRSTSRKGRSRK